MFTPRAPTRRSADVAAPLPQLRVELPEALERLRISFHTFIRVECGLARATLEAYDRDVRELLAFLSARGRGSAAEVTPRDLSEHLAGLKRERVGGGLSATSITRHLATTRIFFRWLTSTGVLATSPADFLER